MILIDTNVLIDIFENDPLWGRWSAGQLIDAGEQGAVAINPVIYAELSVGFEQQARLDLWLNRLEIVLSETPKQALFRAGKAFDAYRARSSRDQLLPDFLIGAHAEVVGMPILTRDVRRYRTYFPSVRLIAPDV